MIAVAATIEEEVPPTLVPHPPRDQGSIKKEDKDHLPPVLD